MNVIPVIDLEASGLGNLSYPIEVGVYFEKNNQIINKSWIIKPLDEWMTSGEWSNKSSKIHNISKESLILDGIDGKEICLELNDLIGNALIFSDCPEMDIKWINKLFNSFHVKRRFKIEHILNLDDGQGQSKHKTFYDWKDIQSDIIYEYELKHHRAKDDALMISKAMSRFLGH